MGAMGGTAAGAGGAAAAGGTAATDASAMGAIGAGSSEAGAAASNAGVDAAANGGVGAASGGGFSSLVNQMITGGNQQNPGGMSGMLQNMAGEQHGFGAKSDHTGSNGTSPQAGQLMAALQNMLKQNTDWSWLQNMR